MCLLFSGRQARHFASPKRIEAGSTISLLLLKLVDIQFRIPYGD
jgi:hypothetical protein